MIYSPSGLKMFETDRRNFFLTYLSQNRPPRSPQTVPMGLGSYFDCRVKDQIQIDVLGQPNLFEPEMMSSVELPIRDEVTPHGERVWELYKKVGAWKWLKNLLKDAEGIETEMMVQGVVGDLELRGIPDLIFQIDGVWIIFDWKVNGYFAKGNGQSPCKYYSARLETGGQCKPHRDVMVVGENRKLRLNTLHHMHEADPIWATQLATYAMIKEIEGDFIGMIDQLTFVNGSAGKELRCAQFRMRITEEFRSEVYQRYKTMDDTVKSGWLFRDISMTASKQRCKDLEAVGAGLVGDDDTTKYMQEHCR